MVKLNAPSAVMLYVTTNVVLPLAAIVVCAG